MQPGAPAADAPVLTSAGERSWFLQQAGDRFTVLRFMDTCLPETDVSGATVLQILPAGTSASPNAHALIDVDGLLAARFDARPGTTYLLRPDQHIAARWRDFDPAAVLSAYLRATCQEGNA